MIPLILVAMLVGAADPGAAVAPPFAGGRSGALRLPVDDPARPWVALGRPEAGQRLVADFIRADVVIERSPFGLVQVKVGGDSEPDLARVALSVNWLPAEVSIIDAFPTRARSSWSEECLPPADERGDFWSVSARLKVTLRLPNSMRANVHV